MTLPSDKIDYYRKTKKQLKNTPAQYKKEYEYLKEVDSLALANVQLQLEQAFRNFFKNRKHFGYPNFKSKRKDKKSYTTNNQAGTVVLDYKNNTIKLPKIGLIKTVIHRKPNESWKLKSATIREKSDGTFFVSVLFEYEVEDSKLTLDESKALGLDYKSDGLYMDSEGRVGSNHKFYRESERRLEREQRKLRHKKVGSKNYKKQQKKINKVYSKATNRRHDNLHKISKQLADTYDIIAVETLDLKAMANKGFGNGKATLDNGYGTFLNLLSYKQEDRGHKLIRVSKWYPSSQLCSCGYKNEAAKNLSARTITCPKCGRVYDRDLNAAQNIKKEGLRLLKEAE